MRVQFVAGVLISVLAYSCGLKHNTILGETINDHLTKAFHTDNIDATISWGTEEENNRFTVVFYDFDLRKYTYDQLDSFALRTKDIILKDYSAENITPNIEIKFTIEKDPKQATTFTSFSFPNRQTK